MPGFDGSGPGGQGPMTGRGMGYCAVPAHGAGQQPMGQQGLPARPIGPWYRGVPGRGLGLGRGRGRGGGRDRGRGGRRGGARAW
jgi:hypothetical protein